MRVSRFERSVVLYGDGVTIKHENLTLTHDVKTWTNGTQCCGVLQSTNKFLFQAKHLWITVFPHIVSGETILFWILEIIASSNSCCNISFFYLIEWILAAETIFREDRLFCMEMGLLSSMEILLWPMMSRPERTVHGAVRRCSQPIFSFSSKIFMNYALVIRNS